ncbi:hypothetical protein Pint_29763 [Pistacia integerrima]|uniref:Uncharacterized protein n=1 Tax=Pistacia integerrima TaxID=434235 RepID=A0ACC0X2D6_9ROSI|nr:hypothetical protein Pint_29763 [Pistacia integerrima]
MSYLSTKQVAQISILSKRWNQLRLSFSIFDVDQTYFLTEDESDQIISEFEENKLALRGHLKEFMEFVDASLLRFCKLKFSMNKFSLFINILDAEELVPYTDKWIGLAAEKEVKELDLDILIDGDTLYTLPQTIFSARFVTTLKLVKCLKRLYVPKALKLKIMNISHGEIETVEIVVPNLQELALQFMDREMPRWCLKLMEFLGISHQIEDLRIDVMPTVKNSGKVFHHPLVMWYELRLVLLETYSDKSKNRVWFDRGNQDLKR